MSDAGIGGLAVLAFLALHYVGTPILADSRGRNWKLWLLLTVCLPIVALLILMLLPDLSGNKLKLSDDEDRNQRSAGVEAPRGSSTPLKASTRTKKAKGLGTMKLEIEFRLQNADSYETDLFSIVESVDDPEVKELGKGLIGQLEVPNLEDFLRRLLSNPTYDGSNLEGLILPMVSSKLCVRAHRKLGWSEVTATISAIKIDSRDLDIEGDEAQVLLTETLALQLVQDDSSVYFYN